MKKFQIANNITGGVVFAIAATVYLMTIEPTVSFWDCGEFITSAYKLEVGHPPGAPLFMLIGNIFSHLTDAANAAKMVNSMSALFSALTILFLFWTITHLTRMMLMKENEQMTLSQTILILGCGLTGSLAYTFSDTFWFSAVEGEVYASSSLFTAVVFWLILKWEEHADAPHAERWIILIAYFMGLSIGVHLLNLLCIPAIVLVYYYKKYPNPTLKGTLFALLISFAIIAIMLFGVVQGLVEVCGWFELFFVNNLGMPYNTGVFVYLIIIVGVLSWAIWETMRGNVNEKRMKIAFILSTTLLGIPFVGNGYLLGILLIAALTIFLFRHKKINISAINTILISMLVIFIGYSTFALILIRATADTPMNQNKPSDIFTLRTYLAREQYGETPLIYGKTYVSERKRELQGRQLVPVTKPGAPTWTRVIKENANEKDRYFISAKNERSVFIEETCMLFPRMYSSEENHIAGYRDWGDVTGTPVTINVEGENKVVMKPTFGENLTFFFRYQLNFMYWRYFMWNFSGRQNDIQGHGNIMHGNWITGIKFLDEMRVGPQDNMPYDIINNKAHNVFYMLPLILGIIGILVQTLQKGDKGIQSFWITFLLFFMTGIAIVLYLNQYPFQPRERDYAYAGSFYAFCIWIGVGVIGIARLLERAQISPVVAATTATVLSLLVPIQMASQTWDDHDRSGRYVVRDFGRNYLESCEPNAILFTFGDNDTFPLWYVQSIEGVRTDVRVCNTSYLQTDWYINQMKRQAYNSDSLPISWTYKDYIQGKRDLIYIKPMTDKPIEMSAALNFMKSDNKKHQLFAYGDIWLNYTPSAKLVLQIDSASVVKNKTVNVEYEPYIEKELIMNYEGKNVISLVDAITLDMINTNKWKRPIYYASTVPGNLYGYAADNLQKTGLALQLLPINTTAHDITVNTKKMYDNVMNKFKWGGIDKPGLYLEENTMRMCKSYRQVLFADLAEALIKEEKIDSAIKVLDRCIEVMPEENVPYDFSIYPIARLYFSLGKIEEAKNITAKMLEWLMTEVDWMLRLRPSQREAFQRNINYNMMLMRDILNISLQYDKDFSQPYIERFNNYSIQMGVSQKKD
ncbi:MAG: DUF2723 domain-containing protein [Tannerella sp.]|jgi:hypothetical protein|nr:DUF2723 domain-containing protein [Tannerella sp.]